MAGIETEELLQDIENSIKVVEQIERIDERVSRINRKPIRLPMGFHVGLISVIFTCIGTGFLFDQMGLFVDYRFFVTTDTLWLYLGLPLVAYPLTIYLANIYIRFAKRWLYRDELEKLNLNRIILSEKMQKITAIPRDYWTTLNYQRMRKYIMNKRAETLKEVLNLLEDDLRDDYFMQQFGISPFRELFQTNKKPKSKSSK